MKPTEECGACTGTHHGAHTCQKRRTLFTSPVPTRTMRKRQDTATKGWWVPDHLSTPVVASFTQKTAELARPAILPPQRDSSLARPAIFPPQRDSSQKHLSSEHSPTTGGPENAAKSTDADPTPTTGDDSVTLAEKASKSAVADRTPTTEDDSVVPAYSTTVTPQQSPPHPLHDS